jgi:FMN phosphatase YigB (HAD superfamily)
MSRYYDREDAPGRPGAVELGQTIQAVTLDFGNTLVPFPAGSGQGVNEATAAHVEERLHLRGGDFGPVWAEERQRQLDEDVPEGREADIPVRIARVLARLRGAAAPADGERWDDVRVWEVAGRDDVQSVVDAYCEAFVRLTPAPPEIEPLLRLLAARYEVAILSNWPLTEALERFADAAGWTPSLSAIVVSQSVGAVKPQPEIFHAAARSLGVTSGPRFLHVGDDLGADVGGAHGVGWRAGWVRSRPADTTLPLAPATGLESPDFAIDRITDLPRALGIRNRRDP